MSALLPLISDLLPMIMPSSIHITKADDLRSVTAASTSTDKRTKDLPRVMRPGAGVTSRNAIIHQFDKMCASLLIAKPMSSSMISHNGEQDAIIYAVSGNGVLATHSGDDENPVTRHDISAGDFVSIPCWTEHQLLNNSDEEVVWVVIRSGSSPTVVKLTEWGGPQATRE